MSRDPISPNPNNEVKVDRPPVLLAGPSATLLSSIISNVLVVVGTAVIVRNLGGESFGKAALLTSASITLGTITSSGICLYILRIIALSKSEEVVAANVWLATIWGQGIATVVSIGLLLFGLFNSNYRLYEYALAALTLHFTTSDALSKNRLAGSFCLIPLAKATVAGSVASVVLQILGSLLHGASGYIVGYAVGTGVQASISLWTCHRSLPKLASFSHQMLLKVCDQKLFHFVVTATLSACIVPLSHWISTLIVAYKMRDYSEVATLTIAMQFFNMVVFVPTILNKIILPKTIKEDSTRNTDSSRDAAISRAWKTVLYASPILLVALVASPLIELVYKLQEPSSILVILLFVVSGILACSAIPLSNFFVSHAKMNRGLAGNLIWSSIYIGFTFLISGGATSAAMSLAFAYGINLVTSIYLVKTSNHAL